MRKSLQFLIILALFVVNTSLFSQNNKEKIDIIYIEGLVSGDYYTLLKDKKEVLKFEIIEACIPKGLLAIKYIDGYNDKELESFMQNIILKKINKTALPTSQSIEDMRNVCSSYREGLNK